jgi:hypothetical protein
MKLRSRSSGSSGSSSNVCNWNHKLVVVVVGRHGGFRDEIELVSSRDSPSVRGRMSLAVGPVADTIIGLSRLRLPTRVLAHPRPSCPAVRISGFQKFDVSEPAVNVQDTR